MRGDERECTKQLMKVFFDSLAMWRGRRMTGLLRGSMQESMMVVAQLEVD